MTTIWSEKIVWSLLQFNSYCLLLMLPGRLLVLCSFYGFFLWYRNVFPWIWIIPAYFMWVTNWPLGCNIFRLLVIWTRLDLVTYSRSAMLHILFPFLLIYEFAQYKVNHAYKRSFLSEVHSRAVVLSFLSVWNRQRGLWMGEVEITVLTVPVNA